MSKTIIIPEELEQNMVDLLYNELNYSIKIQNPFTNDSGVNNAIGYEKEILTKIEMLKLLGHNEMANSFEKDFQKSSFYNVKNIINSMQYDEPSFGSYHRHRLSHYNIEIQIECYPQNRELLAERVFKLEPMEVSADANYNDDTRFILTVLKDLNRGTESYLLSARGITFYNDADEVYYENHVGEVLYLEDNRKGLEVNISDYLTTETRRKINDLAEEIERESLEPDEELE